MQAKPFRRVFLVKGFRFFGLVLAAIYLSLFAHPELNPAFYVSLMLKNAVESVNLSLVNNLEKNTNPDWVKAVIEQGTSIKPEQA